MRKFLSLLVALATVTMAWAAQGGTLTSSKTPIDPTQTVTLTYDGTGTNFANWEPSCFIHAWLVAADGQTLSKSYSTDWASCNGDGDYASLASKLKMTYSGTKGKYTISMNIKEFFNVADADLPKIGKLGVIVRAQYEGDNNKTNDMFVNVAYTTPAAGTSVTYTVESTSKVNVTGTAPEGSSATYASTYNTKCQLTNGNSMTLTLSGFEGNKITGITLSMRSNKSGGKGSLTAVAGTTTIASIADAAFNTASWNGAWSTEYVDIIPTMAKSDYTVQKDENVVITIAASANSLYCQSFTVYYDKGATPPTPVDSTTLYFVNALDWTAVNGFVWPAEGDAYKTWPGEAAKKTADKVNEKDIYSYTFPSSFVNVIFNNGTDQTADLAWAAAKPYFVPGAKNAAGKYEGKWYASKDDIPAPELPAKYYITGDSALVVDAGLAADKAWAPAAIKAAADTTVLNLKAGVEYKLKVTVDGTWSTALGFDALSEKAEGLIADADGNICFKLAEAGAVQVVYFKKGDVVTFKVLGNFYIKPVIVETLKLVPNMWSEAGAKMAAWVWGEGLAGAWTPFFAGEGDTLSVKINAEADSIIFVRMNSDATEPDWAKEWNRVKDEEIDHVGLTYTITAWGAEGVSVGQWTPYEPVVPGKYYITGDSALVVDAGLTADKAWAPAAIKADADTTVLNLKAGVEYKLKVTVDGTWATALGYNALSEKTEGLIADGDDNICFKLAEAGAVQVIYFKEGDVVTFKVLGNFYIKPVIVETLKLVPNMWSEAGAKMAAWVWGEGLAGAWTPFFAGEGDTLSVKINAEADSIIFVRMNSDATEPDWAKEWNRVNNEEIDHVGLTYTITAWGDEGVSVGQWTPYEPVVPGKYYITGDSALVVDAGLTADKAWAPAAIKADADTTVLNLKAGVEYKLKVTVDGTWATALGYNALSEKTEGLIADGDDNICFKLTEAGAVQVIYFKEGDVVTFKVLGNFYIKPVIVETLKLVPNMWSEAGAKMAAWVWGEGLAGAWTPFFAGEGDTLSVKINAEADSIIFVRMNSDATEPDWAKEWNRVNNEEIDHVGLTYTITAWGDEGVSVGQWTPYEPVVPGKYYITGDSALVVDAGLTADKAWAPAAIKADADTTVLNLKAGVEYKLKVTVDGTWATALGYNALSEKTEGLIADGDDNICFKLTEAGAVQVIYFKEGDVVTFKVLGNFYIKPVIVETLKLVPNMWSEAGAKMAAWVWGEGLAGAWTPFFAGEGDTLSVKINAEADSIIFVRMNSDATEPDWAKEWNRVKDEEIDHVGLTYTITDWDKGQWTPYEPAGGCDWDNLPWLGSALPAYAEQFKICLGDPKPGVVNIQESFGTQAGIYVTFPSAAFGQISLSEGQYAIQGAGMLLYVSAFTAKETEVSVVCENVEYVFTVYNDKGGEPVCKDKYGLKVGETVVEFAKNEAQTEWVEYYKQGVELTAGDVIVLYNICEDQTFAAKVAGYEGLTPLVGGDGWTVTETAKYDFYLKLIYGADELYVDKQGDTPVEGKYFITGDSALVVDAGLAADKAWTPAAIKADADTTILNLKANVDYKLKITLDGTWNTALGYDALSEKTEGLIADVDGNICFKLAEAGAVQVIYFKAGDVVTFKVLGNFYIKPVIVETLKLVPNMWSEAGAKMAAWVWGEGLAGAWTPFFAGEGDTLSVKINAEADSIIFVRMNSDATEPDWAKEWNRVKDEEIDHVGLTYTITDWDKGQWTPYEPAGGCDWDNLPWLGSALPAYAEQFKICLGDPKPGVVNIQESFGTQAGIYVTFPSAAFGQISLSEGQYAIQGAGMLLYVSAFTAKETEVSVVCENVEYVFTVYNDKGGEPVCEGKYGLKVGDNVVEFTKNEAQTEWTEYYKQGVELTQGQFIALYNICEETAFTATIAGYEGFTPATGGWTVTETAKYDFYLKLIYGADELYVVKQGSGDTKFYMKNNWNAGADWTWKEMTKDGDNYKLENVVFGGSGVNYNTSETDEGAAWVEVADILGDKIAAKDTVTFVLNPTAKTVTATIVGKYIPTGDVQYFMKNNWNAGADWTWKEMTKDGDNYKLENVVYGGTGVNYNTEATDANATWVAEENILGDKIAAKDTVTLTLDPVAATVTAKLIGKYQEGTEPENAYGLMINGTTFVKADLNPATPNEYMALGVELTAGQTLQVFDKANNVGWVITNWNEGSYKFNIENDKYVVTETAKYDFYFKMEYGNDYIYVAKQGTPTDPKVEVWGEMNDWKDGIPMTLSEDKTKATISANIDPDTYEFKIMVNGEWRSNAQTFTRQNNSAVGITIDERDNMKFVADIKGDYTVTWIFATNELSIVYPTSTAIENLVTPANELRKVMIDGKLYILRDGKVYSVQGQLIR